MRALFIAVVACMSLEAVSAQQRNYPRDPPFTPEKNLYARRLVTEPVQIVRKTSEIDPTVLAAFYKIVPRREIAVSKQRFDSTDLDTGGLPRKLDFAGHTSDLWFVVYEVGGRAYHYTVLVFQLAVSRWRQVAAAVGFPDGDDYRSFARAVKKGSFTIVPDDPKVFGSL